MLQARGAEGAEARRCEVTTLSELKRLREAAELVRSGEKTATHDEWYGPIPLLDAMEAAYAALPDLLAIAEAARKYREARTALPAISDRYSAACDNGTDEDELKIRTELIEHRRYIIESLQALDAALAKVSP